jgi:ABC-type polysaccharide/polyol phosphate export permease
MSEPLRGILPLSTSYIVVLVCNAILCIIALPLFRKYRSRIAYWL